MGQHFAGQLTGGLKSLALQAFGVVGMEEMVRRTMAFGDELVTASRRLGVTIEQLQVLRQMAKENGTELSAMASAFEKIDIARSKALGGEKKTSAAFRALGIGDSMLRTQTAAQLFLGPMHAAATSRSPEDLAPYLRDLMGKGFGQLTAMLAGDYDALEKKMRKIGSIMSTETAVSLKLLSDEAGLLANIILVKVGPALLWLAEFLYKSFGGLAATVSFATTYLKTLFNPRRQRIAELLHPGATAAERRELQRLVREDRGALIPGVEGRKAGLATFGDWVGSFNAMKAEIAQRAYDLQHPKPPAFEPPEETDDKTRRKLVRGHLTALQQIGAYAPNAVMVDVNKKMLSHIKSIDNKIPHGLARNAVNMGLGMVRW